MKTEEIYTVNKINDETYQIDECGRDLCYLLLGKSKALLIDCSLGTGNIKGLVESITKLPITVAATHAHGDHTGACGQFDEIWVHKSECNKIFRAGNTRIWRRRLISNKMKRAGITKKDITGSIRNCVWQGFESGKTFDLGERTVTAIHTPGHSPGSCVFTDSKYNLMFTGDNTAPFLVMNFPFALSLESWLPSAEKTLELSKQYEPWNSHGNGKQSTAQIEKTISLVKEIIEKYPKNTRAHKKTVYPKLSYDCCVVFDSAKVHNK